MFFGFIFLFVIPVIRSELVRVQNGMLLGFSAESKNNLAYRKFLGIPYAEPPVGNLRFQPPVPKKPWSGIHNATKFASNCVQPVKFSVINGPIFGEEDCLYLNVFAPSLERIDNATKIPVIVFIHGGAFQTGSADINPDYIMDRNVIVVSLNYRLGVIGFLGMNNDYISGNYGFKDQALALKWTKANIASFGGDPDNITLMGQSAGSASVHLHMFSPLSKGLFNKAIMQSGSTYTTWAFYDEPYTVAIATALLVITGCFQKNPASALECLQKVPVEALLQAESRLYVWGVDPTVLFKGTIESNVTNQPFLPHKPSKDTYITKDIPWLTGMNSAEAIFKAINYIANNGTQLEYMDQWRDRTIPLINQYLYTTEPERVNNITREIINFYFKENNIGLNATSNLIDMMTDAMFTYPLVKTLQSNDGLRYVYFYNYTASFPTTRHLGVCHSDEMKLLFRDKTVESKWSPSDEQMSKTLLNFWLNFVIYTDPNGPSEEKLWKPVESSRIEYLHINNDGIAMEKDLLKERYDFWDSLPLGRKFT